MPTLDWIAGQEPSTITFKARTVTQDQNSTVMHQEVVTLGGTESTLALAAVLNAAPASTAWALAVRQVAPSTTVNVSSLAGAVVVRSSAADALVTAYQSTAADLLATVSQGGVWNIGTVTAVTAISSLGGIVTQRVSDTNWASSAGFHFNSSGELQVQAAVSVSTTVQVSSLGGAVIVRSSAADLKASVYQSTAGDLLATVSQGGTWNIGTVTTVSSLAGIVTQRVSDTNWASSAGFHFTSSGELITSASVSFTGSTTVQVSSVAGLTLADQGTFSCGTTPVVPIAGYFSTTATTVPEGKAGALRISSVRSLYSTPMDSTGGDMSDSTNRAIRTAVVAGGSTIVQVSSIVGVVTVVQNSTVWAVQLNNYSTTVQVSSLGGAVIVRSSAADLLATVTIGTNLQSTVAPSSGSSGLVVRQVVDIQNVFASTSALASTTVEIQSSGANLRTYVTAYTITSTNQTAAHWGFFSSNATLLWPLTLAALSSAVAGANLAVAAPGYLFRTAGASDALNFKTAGSTVAGVQLGVSYFRAP